MKDQMRDASAMTYARVLAVIACTLLWTGGCDAFDTPRGPGQVPPGGCTSPEGDARLTAEAGAKPLNNLVFELLNVESPGTLGHIFRSPRRGWVYICVPRPKTATDRLPVAILDGQQVVLKPVGEHLEAMRHISDGSHDIAISGGPAERLEVRAIGELFYATYGYSPHIKELGNYSWEFLREHILDSYNSIIGAGTMSADGKSTQEAEIKEWTDDGKRWFSLHPVPDGLRHPAMKTPEEAFDYWTQTLGMQHPLTSGIFADEFGANQKEHFPVWIEALRRIHADPRFKDRQFYAYMTTRLWPQDRHEAIFPFVQTLHELDYRYAVEWYIPEARSRPGRIVVTNEDLRAELGPGWEMTSRKSYEDVSPGAAMNRLIVLSVLSEPGWETGDLYARYDFNVWLDCQFQFLATEPAFFGIRGVQPYISGYCAEEQTRLFAALVRHYAIEGRTDLMLKDPFVLPHLENPDFEDGLEGWTLEPAVSAEGQESIAVKTVAGLGTMQAKYHGPKGQGDVALWTKRNSEKPNVVSQQVKDLVPGRLYSLHFITGDHQEFVNGKSQLRRHSMSVKIENTEPVAEQSFQAIIEAGYWSTFGPFNKNNRYCLNYHQRVFRAKARTARLVLSDWLSGSENSAGGPAGHGIALEFRAASAIL